MIVAFPKTNVHAQSYCYGAEMEASLCSRLATESTLADGKAAGPPHPTCQPRDTRTHPWKVLTASCSADDTASSVQLSAQDSPSHPAQRHEHFNQASKPKSLLSATVNGSASADHPISCFFEHRHCASTGALLYPPSLNMVVLASMIWVDRVAITVVILPCPCVLR